eukprot:g2201.t1
MSNPPDVAPLMLLLLLLLGSAAVVPSTVDSKNHVERVRTATVISGQPSYVADGTAEGCWDADGIWRAARGCRDRVTDAQAAASRTEKLSMPRIPYTKLSLQRTILTSRPLMHKVQECVGAGALADWKPIGGRSGGAETFTHPTCTVRCAPKCEPRMRFDDICDLHCNTPACDFDNGKCAAAARRHLDDGYLMMKVGSKKAKANALSIFAAGGSSLDAYKEIKLVMEEASKFMDEEIPLAIETAEEGTAGIQTWLQAFYSDKKQRRSLRDQAWARRRLFSASKSAVLLQDLRDLTKNMMPDESAEDEDVDVPSSRQQEYANAVLDQLDDGKQNKLS